MSSLHAEGYEEFCEVVTNLEKQEKDLFILFSGSVDSDGKNWCPDCEEAEPVIEEVTKSLPDNVLFLHVSVGPRDNWKDPNNPFRKDTRLRLKCVPTLLRWGQSQRLEESECKKLDLVKMIFEEDE